MRFVKALQLLPRAPGLAWDMTKNLPGIFMVLRTLGARRDLREMIESLTPAEPAPGRGSPRLRWHTVRGIRWAFKVLPLGNRKGNCLPQSLAIYAALRRQGWPVTFASGVRRTAAGIVGHAWVELDGAELPELTEKGSMPDYTPNFRYPPVLERPAT